MRWWLVLEHEINKFIGQAMDLAWFLVPSFAKPAVGRFCHGLAWIWEKLNYSLNAIIKKIAGLRHLLPNLMAVVVGRLLLYPTQFLDWAQNLPQDKLSPKAVLALTVKQIIKFFAWLKSLGQRFVQHTGHGAIIGTVIVLAMAAAGGYFAFTKVFPTLNQHYHFRQPASVIDVAEREEYYLQEQRQFTLQTVELPIWFEDISKRKVMVADLTFQTSNRSSAYYLQNHELLVRDKIGTSLEIVQPSFQLSDEGKQVLCQKIKLELNQLLQDNHEEGHIEQVYVSNLIFI